MHTIYEQVENHRACWCIHVAKCYFLMPRFWRCSCNDQFNQPSKLLTATVSLLFHHILSITHNTILANSDSSSEPQCLTTNKRHSTRSGSQFILKPAPRPEGKIIFAPLAPFDVLFFVLSKKFAQRRSHPKKSFLAPPGVASTPNWEPLLNGLG